MFECPRCHSACISALQKLTLGARTRPARIVCPKCGGKVGVPFGPSVIAAMPIMLGTSAIIFLLPPFLPVPNMPFDTAKSSDLARAVIASIVLILGVAVDVLGIVLQLLWVPLIPR